jgi:hypothetical protein
VNDAIRGRCPDVQIGEGVTVPVTPDWREAALSMASLTSGSRSGCAAVTNGPVHAFLVQRGGPNLVPRVPRNGGGSLLHAEQSLATLRFESAQVGLRSHNTNQATLVEGSAFRLHESSRRSCLGKEVVPLSVEL